MTTEHDEPDDNEDDIIKLFSGCYWFLSDTLGLVGFTLPGRI